MNTAPETPYGPLVTAMVTPFTPDGAVDYARTEHVTTGGGGMGYPPGAVGDTHPGAAAYGQGPAGYSAGTASTMHSRPQRRRPGRMALIGGTAAVLLAAAGSIYAVKVLDGPHRPSKPTLTATLTVPGGQTIDTVWMSRDGRFLAASGPGALIYV